MARSSTVRALTGVLVGAAVVLTGCSSGEPTLSDVTWEINEGAAPTVEFEGPLVIEESQVEVVEAGEGETIEADHLLSLNFVVLNGATGETLFSSYELGQTQALLLSDPQLDPVLVEALVGQGVGTRVLYASPGQTNPETGVVESIIMAVTVEGVTSVLERAEGEAVEGAEGLPSVTLGDNGAPSVELPDTDQPTEFAAQAIIVGSGEAVQEGQSVIAHYTGWLWDGSQFDSSWDRGTPLTITVAPGSVIQGWVDALVGQPVGSQVVMVIPAELGYGEQGQGQIPPNATLVFVVDILAAY